MDIYVRNGTGFQRVKEVHVTDGTARRNCQKVYVHDGNAWRQVFQKFEVLSNISSIGFSCGVTATYDSEYLLNDTYAECGVRVYSDGQFFVWGASSPYDGNNWSSWGQWGTPVSSGAGSSYAVRLRLVSGNAPNYENSANQWYPLSSGSPGWQWRVYSTYGVLAGQYYIDISPDGGNNYVSSAYSGSAISWDDVAN